MRTFEPKNDGSQPWSQTTMPGAQHEPTAAIAAPTSAEVNAAVAQYSRVIEHRLKPGLDAACEIRDRTFEQLAELDQMSKALDVLDAAAEDSAAGSSVKNGLHGDAPPALETRVNIGQEFYVAAHVPQLDRIAVDIGLGVMVEMSRDEARGYVQLRRDVLESQAEKHTKRITVVQAHLKTMLGSLSLLRASASATEIAEVQTANMNEDESVF